MIKKLTLFLHICKLPINVLLYILALFYIISGFLKLFDPTEIINTTNLLLNNVIGIRVQPSLVGVLISLLIIWEIFIGWFFLFRIRITLSIYFLFLTNVFFIVISYLLKNINSLQDCGCFGPLGPYVSPYHFMILYIHLSILILALLMNIKCIRESYYEVKTK